MLFVMRQSRSSSSARGPRAQRFRSPTRMRRSIADICRRLDGIALAIELAAARVKMLSPQQLRDRLDERFRVLTGGSRNVLPRQQTLRALIDWSHDLLDERERVLFRRLGIFVNGFTLEGAVAVGSGEETSTNSTSSTCWRRWSISRWCWPNRRVTRCATGCSNRRAPMPWRSSTDAGERDRVAGRHLRYLRDRFAELLGTSASGPHDSADLRCERCRPNWRTCARRSTVRWHARRSSTAPSCSPTLAGVGDPSDSMRKAWRDARRISRRSRRTSRGCALGCQSRWRTCLVIPAD